MNFPDFLFVISNIIPDGSGQQKSLTDTCNKFQWDPQSTIPIGLHGDGVPFCENQSCEVFYWNFIARPSMERILFGLVEAKWLCKGRPECRCTMDAMLAVFCPGKSENNMIA